MSSNPGTSPVSFQAFRKKKEEERSSRFKPKKRLGSTAKKAKVSNEVKVQVGVVSDDGNGRLKKLKGRTIPVLFNESDDAKILLQKAVDKHARHYKQFDKDDIYTILYQDMTLVKNLPGSSTPFTLGMYKQDLLKPFSKIFFWLCSVEDFEMCKCDNDEEKENEDLMSIGAFGSSEDKDSENEDLMCTGAFSSSEGKHIVPLTPIATLPVLSTPANDKIAPPSDSLPTSSQSSNNASSGIEKYLVSHQCPTCLIFCS